MVRSTSSERGGLLLVVLAGASLGIMSIFVRRLSNGGVSALSITAMRSMFAAMAMRWSCLSSRGLLSE